jgi:HSP20 family protein
MSFTGYRDGRHTLHQLRDEMDRLLTGFLGSAGDGLSMFRNQPAANVWERPDAVLVEIEAPGVKSEQLEISVVANELSIKIHRPETTDEGVTYHRRERPRGTFGRVLRLPVEVNADKVAAELHDGVLTITLPKAESVKPRKINVTGG